MYYSTANKLAISMPIRAPLIMPDQLQNAEYITVVDRYC